MVVSFDGPIVNLVGVLNSRVDNYQVFSLVQYFLSFFCFSFFCFFFVYYCVYLVSIFLFHFFV